MKPFVIFLFFVLSAGIISADSFYHQDRVAQGKPITFVISGFDEHIDYTFMLINKKGIEVLKVHGFRYYFNEEGESFILGLGAIPVNMRPGRYKVRAIGKGVFNNYFFERYMDVKETSFEKMVLTANNKMDNIINGKKDPERLSQSQRLWEAISSFSPYIQSEDGLLSQPIQGRHTSPFGFLRITQYPSGKESTSYHKGEDLAAKKGTPVLSDGKGRVILAEKRIVTGNTVVVEHLPGVKTLYYHMDSLNVHKGEMVERGHKIGEVGTTGFSTGPHLHWEVRIATVPTDPKVFLEHPLVDKSLILNIINTANKKRGG